MKICPEVKRAFGTLQDSVDNSYDALRGIECHPYFEADTFFPVQSC